MSFVPLSFLSGSSHKPEILQLVSTVSVIKYTQSSSLLGCDTLSLNASQNPNASVFGVKYS